MRSDFGQAFRGLVSSPVFAMGGIGTLALGISAAVAAFSVVHSVLLKDLPYADPDQLVTVWPEVNYNARLVELTREGIPGIEAVSGQSHWGYVLTDGPQPAEINGVRVSPSHFDLLGVRPFLGRSFVDADGLPDAPGVTILSHSLWIEAFGGDPDVIGRVIQLSGAERETHEVVGIMPEGFRPVERNPLVWTTLRVQPGVSAGDDDSWYVNSRVARLAPGATPEMVQAQLSAFAARVREELPTIYSEEDVRAASIEPLSESVAGDLTAPLWIALGAVGLVLLSACANVANLLLARGQARSHTFAIRSALGADRGRIVGLLLAESTLLGLIAGLIGTGLSFGLVELTVRLAPADFARLSEAQVSLPVLGFALVTVMFATLTAGLVPALRSSRVQATWALGRASRGTSGRRSGRLMPALVMAQVAMAMVIAMASGLMLRSLNTLLTEDPGLDPEGVLTFRANPGEERYGGAAGMADFYGELISNLNRMPGVLSASAIHIPPGSLDNWSFPTYPEGHVYEEGEARESTNFRAIWPDYFETVSVPLLAGRPIGAEDVADAEFVVVVNQAFVDRWWPGESALGKSVRVFSASGQSARIVGVVGNVRQFGLGREANPELYYSARQWDWAMGQALMVKFEEGNPLDRVPEIRGMVQAMDPLVPLSRISTLEQVMGENAASSRFLTILLSLFGGIAVALGAVGVFGVTAFAVNRRVPEYGVRIALGASRRGVVARALSSAGGPVIIGLGLGLLGALASTRLLTTVLYQTAPTDPVTFVLVSMTMVVVGAIAALLPSLRAGRVDPVEVLSSEG